MGRPLGSSAPRQPGKPGSPISRFSGTTDRSWCHVPAKGAILAHELVHYVLHDRGYRSFHLYDQPALLNDQGSHAWSCRTSSGSELTINR